MSDPTKSDPIQSDATESSVDTSAETTLEETIEITSAEIETNDDISSAALQARIDTLEKNIVDIKARSNADMYNFQKRMEREQENSRKYALEKFASALLDVVDNLERALLTTKDDTNAVLFEGVSLTHKSLLTVLEKYGVSVVEAEGTDFNAEVHQAVGLDPEAPKGKVGKVLQKGYLLSGRLLRPAMVMVGE